MTAEPVNPQPSAGGLWGRLSTLFLAAVMGFAVIGFFVGITDGVPQPDGLHTSPLVGAYDKAASENNTKLIPAISYAEIPKSPMGPTAQFQSSVKMLPQPADRDLFAEFVPSEADKEASSKLRASRRAFNGAPPVIPHAVQNTNDASCYACHSAGMQLGGMKASVMSHAYLANCTQCHAPPAPGPLQDFATEVETNFVGLPAPKAGKRAYPGAPPTIPHSQWMRENCLACHGGPNGWAGMESTHPWRTKCTQCHAPSAVLDQAIPVDEIPMLPPLKVADR